MSAASALDFLAGFVAAEGCFVRASGRFRLVVGLADDDRAACTLLRDVLGIGWLRADPPRRAGTKATATWAVTSRTDLLDVVVPWLDDHLAPCHKRQQYEVWRAALVAAGRTGRVRGSGS